MELVDVSKLKPIEGHGKRRVQNIKKKILMDGVWNKPICVEKNYFLVLDGMHRFEIAKELGFKYIPCELYDYCDVEVWSLRSNYVVTRESVIERGISGNIYPYKTAKHRFPGNVPSCEFLFDSLRGA
jgi:ParB-like chromosome segregation protein Spo0J